MENNDNNYLFELIQDLQSKLSEEAPSDSKDEKKNVDYIHEPKFNSEQKKESKKDNNNFNISDILSNLNLSSFLGNSDTGGFDVNSIMKIQKILSAMNKDDPRKNLLVSLKPFLRKSRQDKINEYITYLSIASALGIFDDKGSGK